MPNDVVIQAILDEIKRLGDRFSRLDVHMSGMVKRMSTIEDVVADLRFQIKTWPDMHFLASAAKMQLEHSHEVTDDISNIKTRLDEIYRTMATDPEIRNLRDDVARFRAQSLKNEVRLGAIEGRIGIESSVEPR